MLRVVIANWFDRRVISRLPEPRASARANARYAKALAGKPPVAPMGVLTDKLPVAPGTSDSVPSCLRAFVPSAHGGASLGHTTRPSVARDHATSCLPHTAFRMRRSAFTLVEMIVVITIILIVVGISLPSVTSMWNDQKISEAENKIQGALMTTRSRSVSAAEGEHGILVFLDENNAQRIVPIARAPVPSNPPCANPDAVLEQQCRDAYRLAYLDVFVVQDARQTVLPKPLRVVPRSVVLPDASVTAEQVLTFSDQELTWNDWAVLSAGAGANQAQRHRNFFAMVFSADGQLLDRRNVLIQDIDVSGGPNDTPDGRGDLTGLPSSYDHQSEVALVDKYFDKSDDMPKPLDSTTTVPPVGVVVPYLIVEASGQGASAKQASTAINFPTVDGVLLYDDEQFQEIAGASPSEARAFLLNTARPLYVNRNTGAIIRGPIGEGKQVK
jgi:prepilin-type N-terminal cleavage/methylation domain-containing protein